MAGDPLPYGQEQPGRRWLVGAGVVVAVLAAWACGSLIERNSPGTVGRVAGDIEAFVGRLLR